MTTTTDKTLQQRARLILADYRRHGDDEGYPPLCNEYYCGHQCSYLDEIDERLVDLLHELAGE